jgi:hypothetical protein
MLRYALTIFLSSFLLFQVQPLMGRSILPWFGGSAAVWTTCMLFFQGFLLAGYLYAHLSVSHLTPKRQAILHIALLAAAALFLPIIPAPSWKPAGNAPPIPAILGVLTATVGVPYFLLSATSPLLQAWYSRTHARGMPYRLFALSNAASLLALVSYPPLVEPYLPLRMQALGWSGAFVLFAVACGLTAWKAGNQAAPAATAATGEVHAGAALLWVLLPAAASALLLSVTTHITQNVAAIPFLWIVPLVLYLLSFIICFERECWYRRMVWFPLAGGGMATVAWSTGRSATPDITLLIALFSLLLFGCCMVCHGELMRLKPHPSRLTAFYLLSSLGGGIGGIFVGVLAPLVFQRYLELQLSVAATAILACCSFLLSPPAIFPRVRRALVAAAPAVALVPSLWLAATHREDGNRRHARNFYGVLTILEQEREGTVVRTLVHGVIQHGKQFLSGTLRRAPTTYYGPESGVGLAMAALAGHGRVDAAVVGLGVGTMAAYGRRGDRITFYEINPLVLELAQREFTYLADSPARVEVIMGDARLSLEQERDKRFDLLAVDAFSGDSIPVHLLTREALELYFARLKPDGVLAVHISNKYLDLEPVLAEGLRTLDKRAVVVESKSDGKDVTYGATWVVASSDPRQLPPQGRRIRGEAGFPCWTDDYCDLFRALKK